jgi:hypothetical protein
VQEVVNLRWEWEVLVPELKTSIFVIPKGYVKNGLDRYVVLNRIAESVIERCRGQHPEFVFTCAGDPVTRIYNSGWKARAPPCRKRYLSDLGNACPRGFRFVRVHSLSAVGRSMLGDSVRLNHRNALAGVRRLRTPSPKARLLLDSIWGS